MQIKNTQARLIVAQIAKRYLKAKHALTKNLEQGAKADERLFFILTARETEAWNCYLDAKKLL